MNLTGEYTFDAAPEAVWALLMDTTAIAGCLPGCKELRPVGEHRYEAELNVAVSAISGDYKVSMELADLVAPLSYRLLVSGTGRMGFVRGEARMGLAPDGAATRVTVNATADVGGPVARVGQRLIEGVARMTMDKFFGCLAGRLGGGTKDKEQRTKN